MTDHDNADETDGQNSKLSRRTALGLMGVSAVGGAAASSAYSELRADRPIDVEVTTDTPDTETGATNSTLEITNNSGSEIEADITVDNEEEYENLYVLEVTNATISGSGPWELEALSDEDTAEIEFRHDDNDEDDQKSVTFTVEGFADTSGFSITSDQLVNVAKGLPQSIDNHYPFSPDDGDGSGSVTDAIGDIDLNNEGASLITDSDVAEERYYEFGGPDDEDYLRPDSEDEDHFNTTVMTVIFWIRGQTEDNDSRHFVFDTSGSAIGGEDDQTWWVEFVNDELRFSAISAGDIQIDYNDILDGEWKMITCRLDSSDGSTEMETIIDDDFDSIETESDDDEISADGSNFSIGGEIDRDGGNRHFTGDLDFAAFSTEWMSDDDIQAYYDAHPLSEE